MPPPLPGADSDSTKLGEVSGADAGVAAVAGVIAKEVGKLAKATEAVPTHVFSMLASLNTITVILLVAIRIRLRGRH